MKPNHSHCYVAQELKLFKNLKIKSILNVAIGQLCVINMN